MRSLAVSVVALFMTTMYWSGMTPGWAVPVTGAGVCATPAAGVMASATTAIATALVVVLAANPFCQLMMWRA